MQDRFKFRFYDKNEKIMIDENSDYEMLKATYGQDEWWWCVEAGMPTIFKYFVQPSWNSCGDRDFVIMQCTGLKDKNGKLIYEGDIVKQGDAKYIVNWLEGTFCFKGLKTLHNFTIEYVAPSKQEVIGNIYENPELLEE